MYSDFSDRGVVEGAMRMNRQAKARLRGLGLALAAAFALSLISGAHVSAQSAPEAGRCHAPSPEAEPVCVSVKTYARDICNAIETFADQSGLDRSFFARLIWQESGFNANAVSPKNAQGIAQFIPSTARLRGLKDPFNPAEALYASARYLAHLRRRFGSLGMAAVAYNAGEERAASLLAGHPFAPAETRNYVASITGHTIDAWLADPAPKPDLSLRKGQSFRKGCLAMAARRSFRRFRTPRRGPATKPWGVLIAAHAKEDVAKRLFRKAERAHPGLLRGETLYVTREGAAQSGARRYLAQIGRDDQAAAREVCARLRNRGLTCRVLKN